MLISPHKPEFDHAHFTMRGESLEIRQQVRDHYPQLTLMLDLEEHRGLCRVVHQGLRAREEAIDDQRSPATAPLTEHQPWCQANEPHDLDACASQLTEAGEYDVYLYLTLDHRTADPRVLLNVGATSDYMTPRQAVELADAIEKHGDQLITELRRLSGLAEEVSGMIVLNDRPKVTPACRPWCAEHDTGPTGFLSHRSEPIVFDRDDFDQQIQVGLVTLESADAIEGPRIYLTKYGEDDPLTLTEARTLIDALNELIAAAEAPA